MSGECGDETDRCPNCYTKPEDFRKGHSYHEIKGGIEYDVEHLNDLGHLRANGISLLFDRSENRLIIEREPLSLREIIDELERVVNTDTRASEDSEWPE